jgi:hypothetical protein
MTSLKSKLTKLAYENPGMRGEILPLLKDASIKTAASREVRSGLVTAKAMKTGDWFSWLMEIKVGDVVDLYWTAGVAGKYQGKAKIVKINFPKVVGSLLEDINGKEHYPKGDKITVSIDPHDRKCVPFKNCAMPLGVTKLLPLQWGVKDQIKRKGSYMTSLKSKLTKLAYENPGMREALLPLIKSARRRGPLTEHLDKYWNDIHDLESYLSGAIQDWIGLFDRGGKVGKDADKIHDQYERILHLLEQLSTKEFSKLRKMEDAFISKHGHPDDLHAKRLGDGSG